LEHLDNPIDFLSTLKKRYASYIDRVILSVPTAFRIDNYRQAKKTVEVINSDHRYWYTPYTLGKIVTRAGCHVILFQFCQGQALPPHWIIKKNLLRRFPALRDTIVMMINF